MTAAITALLALIENLLPAITAGSVSSGIVSSTVGALTTFLPLITTEITALYGPVKNIIAGLIGTGALTAQQIADLKAGEVAIDQAFTDASVGLDPDAPAA